MQRQALSRPLALMLIASCLGACHHYVSLDDMGPAAYMAQSSRRESPSHSRTRAKWNSARRGSRLIQWAA